MTNPNRQPSLRKSAARLAAGLLVLLGPARGQAQLMPPGLLISRSVSGQFIVQSARPSFGSPLVNFLENDTNYVRLDSTLLVVSSERIKTIVWRKLEAAPTWTGKVFLRLYAVNSADDPIVIDSERFTDGWQYRVSLPTVVRRERYLRAIVQVILLEIANRNATGHGAEIPPWLTEGLTREVFESDEREVILPPPRVSEAGLRMTTLLVNTRRTSPLERAHQELAAATPMSFEQLSWPIPEPSTGEPSELYLTCSQVFVHQLLALPGGPARVRTMLDELPRFYNWQFAFLHAFRDSFQRPLEVEKWWTLELVHFTGRELAENWSPEESWQKLDEAVRSAVQIRVGTNDLPLHTEVPLQTIIRDWETSRQVKALEAKLGELQMLRPRLTRALIPLVNDYCVTLETYLQNLNHKRLVVLPFRKELLRERNREQTLSHLNELDTRRASLRPPDKPLTAMQAAEK